MISRTVMLFWICFVFSNVVFGLFNGVVDARDNGSSKEELFSLANLAYQDGRYQEAINGYQNIEIKRVSNPDVYYNLGNAYAKSGREGMAILYYEKSLKLVKKGDDIIHNILLMQNVLALPQNHTISKPPWEEALGFITFKESANISIIFYLATFIFLIIYIFSKENALKKKIKMISSVLVVLTFIMAFVTGIEIIKLKDHSYGIVVKESADLHEFPLESGTAFGIAEEGIKFKLMEENNEWLKVSLPDGAVGWIKKNKARTI